MGDALRDPLRESADPVRWPVRGMVRLAAVLALSLGALSVAIWAVAPRRYASTTEFTSATQRRFQLSGALAAIGGQLGLPVTEPGASPYFLVELLTSRDVLNAVLARPMRETPSASERPLLELLLGHAPETAKDSARARSRLLHRIRTQVEIRTNMVTLEVEMATPELAQAVNRALLDETDRAHGAIARHQAGQVRQFIEQRLRQAEERLRAAEDSQRAFYQTNALFQQSPSLALQERRLQREVDHRQDVFTALHRDYEQALQDEARDVPSLSIVVQPNRPWVKSWPRGSLMLASAMAFGMVIAVVVTLVALRSPEHTRDDTARAVLRASRATLRRSWRAIW